MSHLMNLFYPLFSTRPKNTKPNFMSCGFTYFLKMHWSLNKSYTSSFKRWKCVKSISNVKWINNLIYFISLDLRKLCTTPKLRHDLMTGQVDRVPACLSLRLKQANRSNSWRGNWFRTKNKTSKSQVLLPRMHLNVWLKWEISCGVIIDIKLVNFNSCIANCCIFWRTKADCQSAFQKPALTCLSII